MTPKVKLPLIRIIDMQSNILAPAHKGDSTASVGSDDSGQASGTSKVLPNITRMETTESVGTRPSVETLPSMDALPCINDRLTTSPQLGGEASDESQQPLFVPARGPSSQVHSDGRSPEGRTQDLHDSKSLMFPGVMGSGHGDGKESSDTADWQKSR